MALDIAKVKEELAVLREKKGAIERKIQGLEIYLGKEKPANGNGSVSIVSARGGLDIRPTVRTIFEENGNQPIRVKDLVDLVCQKHSDTDRHIVESKMIHVKRTILEQKGYGMYRLKTETPESSDQGVS